MTEDAITYGNSVNLIRVDEGSADTILITPGKTGISLRSVGSASGNSGGTTTEYEIISFDHDSDPDTAPIDVLASVGKPVYTDDGKLIEQIANDGDSYRIGEEIYTGEGLAQLITETEIEAGSSITGALTINNNVESQTESPGSGASFETNDASGISVKSEGGRGGNGGCSTVLLYTWCDKGGSGGSAGSVAVNLNASITVNGTKKESHGVIALSQGGEGGAGGGWFGLIASKAGRGGDGGAGGEVFVSAGKDAAISTSAEQSHGIYAKSTGGNGGHGGSSDSAVALGEKGGNGGAAGNVEVENQGEITTTGRNSHGIYALSVGAGAGSGSNSGGIVAIGGNGGGQSNGARVTVRNSGAIGTSNDNSFGILAQSIGGGGGDGGSAGGLFAVGGRAGSGGNSGAVALADSGSVRTQGDFSAALVAQSIGGGGGNGGNAVAVASGLGVAVGGNGGLGGNGANVALMASGSDIDTAGFAAHGILAQSVGGGGGNGGTAVSVAVPGSGPAPLPFNLSVALGGKGGGGGDAGSEVKVTTSADTDIATTGVGAFGIAAQSIGGGGGSGGSAYAGALGGPVTVSVALGGAGGSGGKGQRVFVDNAATISTLEARATGILAQSIGGGGGDGGFSGVLAVGASAAGMSLGGDAGTGGSGDSVEVRNVNTINTKGDSAVGIFAQSVGGGGGNGGSSLAATGGVMSLATSVGGGGGGGKNGGAVNIANAGDIATVGQLSYGVFGQSVGGGGGNGGFALSGALAVSFKDIPGVAASVAVGGKGGGASHGGDVNILLDGGSIETAGDAAHAVFAQSIGGGGGNGGFAGSLAVTIGDGAALGVSVGGKGANGGDAGAVAVTSSDGGTIVTHGDGADGIRAQSIGGGGGDGGLAFSGAANFAGKNGLNVTVAVGGEGGEGGTGNTVTGRNLAAITTYGDRSAGMFGQSIGGGGGNGGFAVSASLDNASNRSGSIGVDVGGGGGSGNVSGAVSMENLGSIVTSGVVSHGIFAQSIGGGGGNGGFASTITGSQVQAAKSQSALNAAVSVGGRGGAGNTAGKVSVSNHGTVITQRNNSHAIYAESIGGGGGNGGLAFSANISAGDGDGKEYRAAVAVGGSGGDGNHGGEIAIENTERLESLGDMSHGIYAHSIGGGGGAGGGADAFHLTLNSESIDLDAILEGDFTLEIDVGGTRAQGGNGGEASNGAEVVIDNLGNINTRGDQARGIWAQSIGGGGGSGGAGLISEGDSSASLLECLPCILSRIIDPDDLEVIVGGSGVSGNGERIAISHQAAIATEGSFSHAIFAQSIGGGGGEALIWSRYDDPNSPTKTALNQALGPNGTFALGGADGAMGNGGDIDLDLASQAMIETRGAESHGVYAQSVGGGGGQAGSIDRRSPEPSLLQSILGITDLSNIGLGSQFARDVGGSGNGGNITIENLASITTHGSSSIGILAQSVGGGGGIAGGAGPDSEFSVFAGSVGGNGSSGTIDIAHNGRILTSGYAAHGIFAQSAGGGVDTDTEERWGEGRNVSITMNEGIIYASGQNAMGILAQSTGIDGRGNITTTIGANAAVVGGTRIGIDATLQPRMAAGIHFLEGADNSVTNFGLISTQDAAEGYAMVATSGNDTLDNFGTMTGSVALGAGRNTFNNRAGATFNSGWTVDVGADNTFTNQGVFSPGGRNKIRRTTVIGNFIQSADGAMVTDVDFENLEIDEVTVTGSLVFEGNIEINRMNADSRAPAPMDGEFAIFSSASPINLDNINLIFPESAVIDYQLTSPNGTDLVLAVSVDYAARSSGLNENHSALGKYINTIQKVGSSEAFQPVALAIVNIVDEERLAATYDQMSPEPFLAATHLAALSDLRFADALHGCNEREGKSYVNAEGECVWMKVGSNTFDRETSSSHLGYSRESDNTSLGFQKSVTKHWHLGLGLEMESNQTGADNVFGSEGSFYRFGAVAKRVDKKEEVAVSITLGSGHMDNRRYVDIPTPGVIAESEQQLDMLSLHSKRSFAEMANNFLYARPSIDVGLTFISSESFEETSAGALNLRVEDSKELYLSVAPGVEFGAEFATTKRTLFRPFGSIGLSWFLPKNSEGVKASLEGAPVNAGSFVSYGEMDDVYVDMNLGFEVLSKKGMVFRVMYGEEVSKSTRSRQGSIRFSLPI